MKIVDCVKNTVWHDPRVRKQIRSYLSYDYELSCVGVNDNRYNDEEIRKIGCQVYLNDKIVKANRSILSKIIRECRTNKFISNTIYRLMPDIIHANDLNALIPSYKAYRKISKKKRCFLIYDTHEIFLENPWMNKRKIIKLFWSFFERKIIHKADLVICVSNAACAYFRKKYNIECTVVTNSVPLSSVLSPKKIENVTYVLNQGQFYSGRGYEQLLEAAKISSFDNVVYQLRGFGINEKMLRDYAFSNKLNNVVFEKPVKTHELIQAASKSSIGIAITENISANFLYSVSNKIFEYAAAGLPVIMSDIPEHRLLNSKYDFGIIINENNASCINQAIFEIINSPDKYSKLSKNAITMAKETSWEKEFEKIVKKIGEFYAN